MKIEKINENQIRCTLTKDDLLTRRIKLSELSYGSEKARNLFYDMMQQANVQFGFEFSGTPLMIEAIPTKSSLILNITKVNDPEELDTRFSSFSAPPAYAASEAHISGADGILNLLKKIAGIGDAIPEALKPAKTSSDKPAENGEPSKKPAPLIEAFRFSNLDDTIRAAKAVSSYVTCVNSLYKYDTNAYLLILHSSSQEPESFNRIYNILSEYSFSDHCSEASEKHLREHGYLMIADNAIQKLSKL
ncbi:MAG TPA: adaptor protein MecA [Candidatus Alectryocaccobium stercorigallinarum]|nr:adaptor protein MecA [Candidatus Alectryocaccobium stercorigallinarum]